MVLAALTAESQTTARKLATPVDGADDQGPAADPAFMQTLFSRLLMILGAVNPLFVPVLLAVNVLTENVDFAALVQSSAEDLVAADPGADSLTAAQRLQIQGHYDNPVTEDDIWWTGPFLQVGGVPGRGLVGSLPGRAGRHAKEGAGSRWHPPTLTQAN